jgi:hypothetical protein
MMMTRAMTRLAGLAALGLLAACSRSPATPAAPENPELALCREEARNIPLSRELRVRMLSATMAARAEIEREQAEAESRAFNDCLRRRGVLRGGGVEPVRRPGLF